METIGGAGSFSSPNSRWSQIMNALSKAMLIAAGALTLSTGGASAAVVCNDEGDCWRVKGRPTYGPELRLQIHPDDWRWEDNRRYRWREHGRGNGYWRNGVWIEIR
jgi:hypothetical protein